MSATSNGLATAPRTLHSANYHSLRVSSKFACLHGHDPPTIPHFCTWFSLLLRGEVKELSYRDLQAANADEKKCKTRVNRYWIVVAQSAAPIPFLAPWGLISRFLRFALRPLLAMPFGFQVRLCGVRLRQFLIAVRQRTFCCSAWSFLLIPKPSYFNLARFTVNVDYR